MIIDCDECAMQHTAACDECIVAVLLDGPASHGPSGLELDDNESEALGYLADAGLVAPLRLVPRKYDDDAATG